MAIPKKDDFLVKREEKADAAHAAEGAVFTYFGPSGAPDQRHRFLVIRENGDEISVQPATDARFKVGLDAWRWKEAKGGSPESYLVIKTTSSRVDLKKMTK